jgi:hypothetical protein
MIPRVHRRFAALYAGWILCCAVAFVLLRHAEDPSRRHGRILSNDAAARAVALLETRGVKGYEAVHVAYANRGEGGKENRWIELCDRVPHSALRDALVVELRAADGTLLTVRRPHPS